MKLPSIRHLLREALDTFSRFPFSIFSAVVATGAALVIVHQNFAVSGQYQIFYDIGLVAFLGIPIFSALQLIAERAQWTFRLSLAGKLVMSGVLAAYYFLLPANVFEAQSIHLIRYALFSLAAHLLVAVGPFAGHDQIHAFWEYNKILFLRILIAALYTGVLFSGLVIALVAIDQLFSVSIDSKRYVELWWFLAGVFNTWFFLSGVPKKSGPPDVEPRYPKGLKIFTQYVMIPLVAVYFIILYAYAAKIIVEWNWPKGWVGYLVLGFSITGILSLLLVHPIRNKSENKWIAAVWRWFFVVLLPLVVLLLLAVLRRVSEYGITERRYFVIVLGLWLAAISLYFIFSKMKNIKIIPASLLVLALAVSFGPWGAFSVSERNQIKRLETVLVKNGILVNGKVQKAGREVSFEDARRINAIVYYLEEEHSVSSLQPWFNQNLDTVLHSELRDRWFWRQENSKQMAQLLGVQYMSEWETKMSTRPTKTYNFFARTSGAIEIRLYRYFIGDLHVDTYEPEREFHIGNERWKIALQAEPAALLLTPRDNRTPGISFDLGNLASRLMKLQGPRNYVGSPVSQDSMTLEGAAGRVQVKALLRSFNFSSDSSGIRPTSVLVSILMSTGD